MKQSESENSDTVQELGRVKDDFITQWGIMGHSWGINRTMAQLHALLLAAEQPLTTDQIMAELKISRGNAHSNLRELIGWGLIRSVIRKGERKEFFEAEKDVWKIFCMVVQERKRREISPAVQVLKGCIDRASKLKTEEAKTLLKQFRSLCEFLEFTESVMEKVAKSESSKVIPWAMKFFK